MNTSTKPQPQIDDTYAAALEAIESLALEGVTGGCAACGDPNHKLQQEQGQQIPPSWAR